MAIAAIAKEARVIRFPDRMHPALWLAVALAACAHAAPADAPVAQSPVARPAAPPSSEARWLTIALGGEPVGRSHEVIDAAAGGGFATRATQEVRIGRLGKVVEMATDVTLDEDAQGQLRAVHGETRLSRQVTTSEVSFAAGAATVRESAGGPVHTRSLALAGPLMGPVGIRRTVAAKLRGAGDTVEYLTWSVGLSAPQRVQCTAEAFETVSIDGAPTRLLRAKVEAEREGRPRTAWFDASGRELRSEFALPFGTMVASQVSTEPQIRRGDLPPDMFAKTLIRSNVRLPRPRALDKLVVRLAFADPVDRLLPLDSADERVTERDASGTVIEIDRAEVPASGAVDAPVGPEYLAASAIIDPTEPAVRAIAAEVTAGASDPWDQAQRLTRWVTEHMTFDAGIAFAPAAELARDRHGTCAGYAVLLASLLRAAHIPSRLDLGLVYIGGVFGGHAWVEAHIRGRWIPLDAAIPGEGPADAARIAFGRDALNEGAGAVVSSLGRVVGAATIRVIAYAPRGQALVRVDERAPPYTIDGARYTNHGLGLSITAPPGYRFTDLDAVWPARTVLALEGRDGRVTVAETSLLPGREPALAEAEALELRTAAACEHRTVAGRVACATHRDGIAGLAFRDGPSLFVIEARGRQARSLLEAVAGSVRLDDLPR